jgi:photosystem II stability/assembly factor-like uncharacterized protein
LGPPLFGVSFIDADRWWVVGGGGAILGSMDGGASWLEEQSGVQPNLNDVSCTGGNAVFTVGDLGVMLKKVYGD